jgi:SAM-dependent methyltransferase
MRNSLDLGCGENPRNPFEANNIFGVDVRNINDSRIKVANLFFEPIPFGDEYFDFVTAFDFIEHIPRVLSLFNPISQKNEIKNPFIDLMNEVYRVLKMGGLFYSHTPALPHPAAFQDPTHVNFITEKTFPLFLVTCLFGSVRSNCAYPMEMPGMSVAPSPIQTSLPIDPPLLARCP